MARKPKVPARKVLKQCAAMLYRQVNNGLKETVAQRRLHGGLILTLQRLGEAYYTLSLTRKGVYPSVIEQDICIEVFGIPYTAIISRDFKQGHHIVKYRWSQGRGRIIRQISQAHLLPGVGLHNWRAIIEAHQLNEPSDYNHYSMAELMQILAQFQEVSNQWLHYTQQQPEKAHPVPRNG